LAGGVRLASQRKPGPLKQDLFGKGFLWRTGFTIRGGIACSDSTNLRVIPSRSTESSLPMSDLPNMDSQASSSDDEDNERTVSTVATDADASLIFDMLHADPEFDSLRLNGAVSPR